MIPFRTAAPLAALAEEHGTPFYLYDGPAMVSHARTLRGVLPPYVDLLYCVKANANRALVELLGKETHGLDVSSGGELAFVRRLGFPGESISFAGPGKRVSELRLAVREGASISVESPTELERIIAVAADEDRTARVAIRVNPKVTSKSFGMRMGGQASAFGVAEEDALPVVKRALAAPQISLEGFHVFAGTQCLEAPALAENARQTLDLAAHVMEETGARFTHVNLGGGFGVPYFEGQPDLDAREAGHAVGLVLEERRLQDARFSAMRFVLELGRFLTGRFGVYVARVNDVKETRGKRIVVLDGGMNHVFPATGNFGQLVKKNYPIVNLSREGEPCPQDVVGPLCTPIDSLARELPLPRTEIGDLIAFLHVGAYSYAASPLLFLGHATPPELLWNGTAATLARPSFNMSHFA
jgi:diaminopimelate decarboxylase